MANLFRISIAIAVVAGADADVNSIGAPGGHCGIDARDLLPPGMVVPSRVYSQTPAQARHKLGLAAKPLPKAFDWRFLNGTFTTRVGNQMLPSPCGSCWAFASSGALSDRVKIATHGLLPDFNLAPQGLLDCGALKAGSCNGGSHTLAYEFASEVGLTDETCLPYRGMDYSNWGESDCADRMCRKCDRFGMCSFMPRTATTRIFAYEHGTVRGVEEMQAEIAARGPIACLMYAHSESFQKYTGGVITDTIRYDGITHVVVVTGWGVDKAGVTYWIVRNSFGMQWGELGYFRMEMGKDIYNMESHDCAWATPSPSSIRALMESSGLYEAKGALVV